MNTKTLLTGLSLLVAGCGLSKDIDLTQVGIHGSDGRPGVSIYFRNNKYEPLPNSCADANCHPHGKQGYYDTDSRYKNSLDCQLNYSQRTAVAEQRAELRTDANNKVTLWYKKN